MTTTQHGFDAATPLAEWATHVPAASRVFHRHRLDFCCGGRQTLEDACAKAGLEAGAVVAEIDAAAPESEALDWSGQPLDALIDHILLAYHEPLRVELPQLVAMARKVETVHAKKPAVPTGLAAHLEAVLDDVELHLQKEEQILFPALRSGAGAAAGGPIRVMEQEHDEHAEDLQRTRSLTRDLQPPPHACTTWRALYLRLAQLERDLMDHIHLENNVLFPRALGR